jgi:hypothetical protein
MSETMNANGGENEAGKAWEDLTQQADAVRAAEGPGTDAEAALRAQANALRGEVA